MQQIDDLVAAYTYSQTNVLHKNNFMKAHGMLAKNFRMHKKFNGKYRKDIEVTIGSFWVKVYKGCEAVKVKEEMTKLFEDISILKSQKLTCNQTFYYASMIHLVFVKIHPFGDGNGRAARLLEK